MKKKFKNGEIKNGVFHVDGTLQPNISAYPPGWHGVPGQKMYPTELIEFTVVYPEPDLKKKASRRPRQRLPRS